MEAGPAPASQENNRLSTHRRVVPSFSAGFKIYNLTLTPDKARLSVGERLVLVCTAHTELNVGLEFNWTHSGQALVSITDTQAIVAHFLLSGAKFSLPALRNLSRYRQVKLEGLHTSYVNRACTIWLLLLAQAEVGSR